MLELEARWHDAVRVLGGAQGPGDLAERYAEPHRGYHNAGHVLAVVRDVDMPKVGPRAAWVTAAAGDAWSGSHSDQRTLPRATLVGMRGSSSMQPKQLHSPRGYLPRMFKPSERCVESWATAAVRFIREGSRRSSKILLRGDCCSGVCGCPIRPE